MIVMYRLFGILNPESSYERIPLTLQLPFWQLLNLLSFQLLPKALHGCSWRTFISLFLCFSFQSCLNNWKEEKQYKIRNPIIITSLKGFNFTYKREWDLHYKQPHNLCHILMLHKRNDCKRIRFPDIQKKNPELTKCTSYILFYVLLFSINSSNFEIFHELIRNTK